MPLDEPYSYCTMNCEGAAGRN